MAEKKISQLTNATTPLAGTEVVPIVQSGVTKKVAVSEFGGSTSWGTITGILSAQTDLNSALTAKQDTLVSGTNLKTINSTTLLGSGNVAVQPTLVSGTNIKTINSTTLLGSGDVAVQPTLVSGTNIKTINGSSVLGSGDVTISGGNRLATHVLSKPRSQFYYSLALTTNNLNVGTYTQNQLQLSSFTPAYDLTINTFNFEVTTLFSGGLVKLVIYSDLDGVPYSKLLESVDVSTTTTGLKTITGFTFTFTAGTTYWIGGISNNSTAGFRCMSSSQLMQAPIIATSSATQVYNSWLINSVYATLPSTITTPTVSNLNLAPLINIVFRAV